jgi:hypothetical protein
MPHKKNHYSRLETMVSDHPARQGISDEHIKNATQDALTLYALLAGWNIGLKLCGSAFRSLHSDPNLE